MTKSNKQNDDNSLWGAPSTKEEMLEITKKLKKLIEESYKDGRKKKISFSISPVSQVLVKNFADELGVTQGSIVEFAPILIRIIARKSMARRSKALETLKLLKEQISSSLKSMKTTAPHLGSYIDTFDQVIEEIISMESESIREKNYKGVDDKKYPLSSTIKNNNPEPSFYTEIMDFIGKDTQLIELFKTIIE